VLVEIIEQLIEGGKTLRRPVPPTVLSEMPEFSTLLSQCWAEAPNERPTFADISKQLKRLNRGRYHILYSLYNFA